MMNELAQDIFFVHPSLLGGGAERVALALASYFVQNGYHFTFLLTKDKSVKYPIPSGVAVVDDIAGPSVRPLQQILYIRDVMKANPQAPFISFLPHQNMYTLIASIGLSNKVIISVRNDPRFDFPNNRILPKVRDVLYRKASAIVFQTKTQMGLLPLALQAKGTVILNPISNSVPEPYTGTRRKVIVTSGRLEEQKNHEMTIRAFAQFHEIHSDYILEIFGEGSMEAELKNLAKELGVAGCVMFEGFSARALEHVRTASAFVMSSRFEGLSNSMLEALAMGVPTVCARCGGGGAEAVINDGVNGVLVDVDDIDGEAEALLKIIDDSDYARSLSCAALELRDKLNLASIGACWEELLKR